MQAEDSDSDSSGDELTTYPNRDGTQSSATAAELKLAAALSKDPWGRFGGRAGKMARIRAQEAETLAAMQVPPLHSAIHLILYSTPISWGLFGGSAGNVAQVCAHEAKTLKPCRSRFA